MIAAKARSARKARRKPALRASVSFPDELYRTLEQLAEQKKVSVAWVVREAAAKYVAAQWPLLEEKDKESHD
jgi:predicted transcriptional regulator